MTVCVVFFFPMLSGFQFPIVFWTYFVEKENNLSPKVRKRADKTGQKFYPVLSARILTLGL